MLAEGPNIYSRLNGHLCTREAMQPFLKWWELKGYDIGKLRYWLPEFILLAITDTPTRWIIKKSSSNPLSAS